MNELLKKLKVANFGDLKYIWWLRLNRLLTYLEECYDFSGEGDCN